jgi:hypothetical protein
MPNTGGMSPSAAHSKGFVCASTARISSDFREF